jgi:hydrogenase expression/formation protein HypC
MCLAIPGEILEVSVAEGYERKGKVRFAGIVKEVNLAFVPEAAVGEYVIVHAGFAISRLDQDQAARVLETLDELAGSGESS